MTALALAIAFAASAPETLPLTEPGAVLRASNDAFLAGNRAAAAAGYRRLRDAGFTSTDLQYNLGLAELALGHRGLAVLAFERALKLDPLDDDARKNLALARAANVDQVVGGEPEPLWERASERVPLDPTAAVALGAWLAAFALVLAGRLRSSLRRRIALPAVLLFAVALLSGAALAAGAWVLDASGRSVVVADAAKVHEGPSDSFKSTFEVHEGLTVRVVDREGRFVRIRLPNGLEGWLDEGAVAAI